jgi:hypothetical protein
VLATKTSTFGSSCVVLESLVAISGTEGVTLALASAAGSSVLT